MKINRFDEDLKHREILPYEPIYSEIFTAIKEHVETRMDGVVLFHIGSTAVAGLLGKPMIDIFAESEDRDLRAKQREFQNLDFHRRDVWVDTDEKPYVCGSIGLDGRIYNINIHICDKNDPALLSAISFLNILKSRPESRRKYEAAKLKAHSIDPVNPQRYNQAKESVINEILNGAQ